MNRTDAVFRFLKENARADLARLYSEGMEVQVNVAQDNGERTEGTSRSGKRWWGWKDKQGSVWKNFRIPWKAKSDPEYVDSNLNFSIEHFEGVGLTGWDWKGKKSVWVGFDFDSIVNHGQGLTEDVLDTIREEVCTIPWVTVRKSTSGRGLHLYVFIKDSPEVKNHTEHAALARSILGLMDTQVRNCSLEAQVDCCGSVLWFWHRRQGRSGFELIKKGESLSLIPQNWKDHVDVICRRNAKVTFHGDPQVNVLRTRGIFHPLDKDHLRLLGWFERQKTLWWWDSDRHMLVCHTVDLKKAHEELCLRGMFDTISTGKDKGNDQNCFAFPLTLGWVVRRHSKRIAEHTSWEIDNSGWTRCYYDRSTDLKTACRIKEGSETKTGGYILRSIDDASEALSMLNIDLPVEPKLQGKNVTLKEAEGRVIITVPKGREEDNAWITGWAPEGRTWQKVIHTDPDEKEIEAPDEIVRHVVQGGRGAGWFIKARGLWIEQDKGNALVLLRGMAYKNAEVYAIISQCLLNYWTLTEKPFAPEYPGNRVWNKDAPQLAYIPKEGPCPHWNRVFDHLGQGLEEAIKASRWTRSNAIGTGGDYLRLWAACLLRKPLEPLPYLFFYGEQNTGKSLFHEALRILLKKGIGYVRADHALKSAGGFNAELRNSVLCVVEETNLKKSKDAANRIKDLVTSKVFSLHEKGKTPYVCINTTHWIQCANDPGFCPIFPGDTRITMIYIPGLEQVIPKAQLLELLEKEAPYFLEQLLSLDIPDSGDRLAIPVLDTNEKKEIQDMYFDPVREFMAECTFPADGHMISMKDTFAKFCTKLSPSSRPYWTPGRFSKNLSRDYQRAVYGKARTYHIINRSLEEKNEKRNPLVIMGGRIVFYSELEV